jgi:hypothetical protein
LELEGQLFLDTMELMGLSEVIILGFPEGISLFGPVSEVIINNKVIRRESYMYQCVS